MRDDVVVTERDRRMLRPYTFHVARALAYAVNPLILPPVLFGLVLAHFEAPAAELGWVLVVASVFFAAVPLGYVLFLIQRQRAASVELPDRAQRKGPLLVGAVSYAIACAVVLATGRTAVTLIAALMACHVVNTLVTMLVTQRWKISVHVLATAGFASMLLFIAQTTWPALAHRPPEALLLQPEPLMALLALVPLMMWARVRTRAHTIGQVSAAAAYGLLVPYAELTILWRMGLL